MQIKSTTYKNKVAITLENDILQVSIIPDCGAKIASLIYKPLNHELLCQNDSAEFVESNHGDCFEDGECAGIDDMFPTIESCVYPSEPWKNIQIPDHGEVWSLPWDCEFDSNKLHCKVKSKLLPYTLEKIVKIEERSLIIDYKLTNHSEHPLDYIWAAHPLFKGSEGMQLKVPEGMDKVINAHGEGLLPEKGRLFDFPVAKIDSGTTIDISQQKSLNDTSFLKYYFAQKMSEGWCKIFNPKTNIEIKLKFPKEKVPYLGIWINEGGWDGQYCFAPEPATGAMDSLTTAKNLKMNSVVNPKSTENWFLEIAVNQSTQPT